MEPSDVWAEMFRSSPDTRRSSTAPTCVPMRCSPTSSASTSSFTAPAAAWTWKVPPTRSPMMRPAPVRRASLPCTSRRLAVPASVFSSSSQSFNPAMRTAPASSWSFAFTSGGTNSSACPPWRQNSDRKPASRGISSTFVTRPCSWMRASTRPCVTR
ncbi:hypothetical protein [Corallococcus sp. 4LFB]|uniref:hypothetical protein n=1 Tax=Corallococcus sp. 4LFB TaxID=3383249 RepID=UPI003976E251